MVICHLCMSDKTSFLTLNIPEFRPIIPNQIASPHECKFWYKANICNTFPIKANICNMKAKSCNKVCCRNLPYLDRLLQIFAFMLQIFALFGQVLHFFPFKSWSMQHIRSIKAYRLLFFSSVTLGLQTHEHQLTLELISLGSPF